jgi:anti-sigma regulatory factor (Ser/Thr protein kinase)
VASDGRVIAVTEAAALEYIRQYWPDAAAHFAPAGAANGRGAPTLGFWKGSRKQTTQDPFAGGVRHVLGFSEAPDPHGLRATLKSLQGKAVAVEDFFVGDARYEIHAATSSAQKAELIGLLDDFCGDVGVKEHVIDELAEVFDELFTNAFYHAPMLDGVRVNSQKERSVDVESARAVTVTFAADSRRIALAMRDDYGSLEVDRVLSALGRCFGGAGASVSEGRGGAGVGIFMMLQKSNELAVNIVPNKYTEFVAVRSLEQSRRDFARSAPTMHIHADGAAAPR